VPLVRFKIFAADGGPVPNGATITSATLSLYKGTGSGSTTFEARRLLRNWDEASAQWQNATSSVSWTTSGAQGSGSDIASSADGQGSASSGQWLSINVTASVQSFAGGTANYGWRIGYASGDGSGNSFKSREASTSSERPKLVVVYAGAPNAPGNLGGSVSGTTVTLGWTDNSSDETGFKLERKTGAGGTYGQIAAPAANATSYSDTGLAFGTTYYYRIRATNADGDSAYSNELSRSIDTLPAAPSGLSAAPSGNSQINLAWTDASGNETAFKIERKTGAGGTYAQIATTAANATSYSNTGLAANTAYFYRVRAANAIGDSDYSNEASAATDNSPTPPSGLSATPISYNQINLAWTDASSNETGFGIERKTGAGGTYAQIATTAAGATGFSDGALAASTTYYYRVRATGASGDSAYANEASATTGAVVNITNGTVEYTYDHFGNLKTTNAGGVVTTLGYDLRGRKISMTDPDMGAWTYAYNALGELIRQVDAKSQTTTMAYDKLGRMVSRTEADLNSTWTYDACTKGVGKLCQATAGNDYARSHGYDSLGRPSSVSITVGTAHSVTTTYDSLGRVDTLTYPTGFAVRHVYNAYSYLQKVQSTDATPVVFWQANSQNAAGQVTGETLGNDGLTATRTYDALFRLKTASASNGPATPHSQSFDYDAIGNLAQRTDVTQLITENFSYDSLNRLLVASGTGLVSRFFDYDAIGNITYKSDVGTYSYGAKPHAVASVGNGGAPNSITASYGYDANGSLTSASGTIYPASGSVAFSRSLSYMSFNLPNVLTHVQGGATYSYTYTYSAEHERVRLVTARPEDTLTSIYIHPAGKGALLYEKETRASDGLIEHKHYVNGGAGLIGVYVTKSTYAAGDGAGMRYYHKDHLGSVAVITNAAGAVIERLAYEAFGERRYPSGSPEDRSAPLIGVTTDRGFTAHEHLDEMMLIHMNGRIYDPVLARFMTADPFIQDPNNLQSYNRYSYGFNNPLSGIDPSGYGFFSDLFDAVFDVGDALLDNPVKAIATIAVAYFTGYWIGEGLAAAGSEWAVSSWTTTYSAGQAVATGYTLSTAGAIAAGAGSGFAAGFIASGGDLSEAFRSALSGGISGGVRGFFGSDYPLERIAANSVAGGIQSILRGGSFSDGARTSFAYSALAYLNVQMRNEMIQQSMLDPRNDGTGLSGGMFGDQFHLGGGRWDPFAPSGAVQCSSLGCLQSGPGSIFGISYSKGGFIDMIVESFAGPHDTANSRWFYDSNGLIKNMTGVNVFALDMATNYTTSLIFAAPFAAGAIYEQMNFSAYRKFGKP
jgi:RHS repeat-associated protein